MCHAMWVWWVADERQRVMEEELKSHQAQLHERRKQLSTAANHISCLQVSRPPAYQRISAHISAYEGI